MSGQSGQGSNTPTAGPSGIQYASNPMQSPQYSSPLYGSSSQHSPGSQLQVMTRPRLQDLVREVDPTIQLDEEVEDILLQMADTFIDTTVTNACTLAKHRNAATVEIKDVQLLLERQWNMWIPGFGNDEVHPYKRAAVTEAHKQRMALIRKSIKKY